MLDNSPKAAVVRNYLRNNYAYIGGKEAKYQTVYNSARDLLYYNRDKRDCILRKDSLRKQLAQAVDNYKERRLHYNMFEIETKRYSKKNSIVYASNEGLALLKLYSIFIVVDGTHNTNKARFILLNICIQDRNRKKRPVAYMLIQSQYSIVLAAGFTALSSQVDRTLGSWPLRYCIVDDSASKQNAFRLVFNLLVEVLLCQRHALQTIRRKYSKKRRYKDTQTVLLAAVSFAPDILQLQVYLDQALQSLLGGVNNLLYNYTVREWSIDFVPIQAICFRRDNLLKIGIRTTNYVEAYYSEYKHGNENLIKKWSISGTLSYSIDTDRKWHDRADDVADKQLQLPLFRNLGYERFYDLLYFMQVKLKDQYRKVEANN